MPRRCRIPPNACCASKEIRNTVYIGYVTDCGERSAAFQSNSLHGVIELRNASRGTADCRSGVRTSDRNSLSDPTASHR